MNNTKKFLQKVNEFIPEFEKKIKEKLKLHQQRNTKISVDSDNVWVEKDDIDNSCISIYISYSCHGKHPTEGNWIYYLKRGIDFNVSKNKKQDKSEITIEPIVYYMDDAMDRGKQTIQPRQFTLKQIGSKKVVDAIVMWLNEGLLNVPIFYYDVR